MPASQAAVFCSAPLHCLLGLRSLLQGAPLSVCSQAGEGLMAPCLQSVPSVFDLLLLLPLLLPEAAQSQLSEHPVRRRPQAYDSQAKEG